MSTPNPQTTGKYVVVLAPTNKTQASALKQTQKALGVKLTSSSELGGGVRAQDVYESGSGIVFKNLQVAVVESVEEERLAASGEVLYWEKERIFRSVSNPMHTIEELRISLGMVGEQVDVLERQLRALENEREEQKERMTWGLQAIGLSGNKFRGAGVKVAVLDSGLDGDHPDFTGRDILGKSFVTDQAWNEDGSGHGTHCAGVIAGGKSSENGLRYGIAPAVELLVGKVLANNGNGTTGSILDGIDWALEKGARVLSLSLGSAVKVGQVPSALFERVGERSLAMNCLIVAAAGNDSRRPRQMPRPVSSPADAQSILAVAAVDRNLNVAYFSNAGINAGTGGRIDLSGPGVEVYSTYSRLARKANDYLSLNGTSMAAPHVAAVAALYLERFPSLSASELWLRLEKNARELEGQRRRDVGAGIIRMFTN